MSAALLEVRGIHKKFSTVPVLKDVTFSLLPGQTLGVMGENGAGKSTLMNILGGNVAPDCGAMFLEGTPYVPRNSQDATERGIAFVHQELNLFPNLTIAENLFLRRFPTRRLGKIRWIDRKRTSQDAGALLSKVGLDIPPETKVEGLSAGERQLVEIAKALALHPRIVILDEPTTSLTDRESRRLFDLLGALRSQSVAMVYISHNLGDVMRLCDALMVLRDGAVVGSGPPGAFNLEQLITLMVGRSIGQMFPVRTGVPSAAAALEATALSEPGIVKDITFTLHRGEVLGIAGLMGSGRSELARILFGLDPCARGQILVSGQAPAAGPRSRIASRMGFLTEDRHQEGLCLEASIGDNIVLVSLRDFASRTLQLIDIRRAGEAIGQIQQAVGLTRTAGADQPVRTLSGGNQQKVVLAKWLLAKPAVLILDEPTRGIDVGAKADVYRLISQLADQGTAVLMISSEIEELIGMCDRILVMSQGAIRDELPRAQFNRERILRSALGSERESSAPDL